MSTKTYDVCNVKINKMSPFNDQPPELFNPAKEFDMTGDGKLWYARPQLFFTCLVCPRGQNANQMSHRKLPLVFFCTFDPIQLSPESIMHEKEVPMLCEDAPSQIPQCTFVL